jgi:PilZ domain
MSNDHNPAATIAGAVASQRRTQRVLISIPVLVIGGNGIEAFRQSTKTITVSAHGCLLSLAKPVLLTQDLRIWNPATNVEVQGKVAFISEGAALTKQVGIEFSEPSPRFWGIAFPPEDWNRAERKLPPGKDSKPALNAKQGA